MKEEKLIKRDNDEERNTSESVQWLELSNTYSQHETHFTSHLTSYPYYFHIVTYFRVITEYQVRKKMELDFIYQELIETSVVMAG